jgi:hypothetical protein
VTLCKFELRSAFAVRIYRLFFVKIDAIGHQFGFYGYAVMMELMVGVYVRAVGPFADGVAMACLALRMDNGIAATDGVRLGADTPERGRYSRGAARE